MQRAVKAKKRKEQKNTVKIGPAIDATLYQKFVRVARQNGQSQRFLLERALAHYLDNVVPSQQLVRPEVLESFRRSNERNQELLARLARP